VIIRPERQQQHVVSKGLQKNFADADDRVTVIDAQSGAPIALDRPIKSNSSQENFLTYVDSTGHPNQSLEREFAKTEQKALNQIRDITPKNWPSSRDRVCVPMHNHPNPIFAGHDHRCPQTDGSDGILSADFGPGSLNPSMINSMSQH
jgi:hypothetical protein